MPTRDLTLESFDPLSYLVNVLQASELNTVSQYPSLAGTESLSIRRMQPMNGSSDIFASSKSTSSFPTVERSVQTSEGDAVYLIAADNRRPDLPARWAPLRKWQSAFITACEQERLAVGTDSQGVFRRTLVTRGKWTYEYVVEDNMRWLVNTNTGTRRLILRAPTPVVIRYPGTPALLMEESED
jgi:hypothetical protein